MAVDEPYATPALYRATITHLDNADDYSILQDLIGISRLIDEKLHRFFTKDTALVTRIFTTKYYGSINAEAENPWKNLRGDTDLYVDDIADATDMVITLDSDRDGVFDTVLAATDYRLYPLNAMVGPEPKPYTVIHLTSYGDQRVWTPAMEVSIQAIWGWPSIPKAIQSACIQLTAILRIESPRATTRVTEMGQTIAASKEAQGILESLKLAYRKQPGV